MGLPFDILTGDLTDEQLNELADEQIRREREDRFLAALEQEREQRNAEPVFSI
jgi:hypothetical protein